jgi:hypothetical protein
MKRAPSDSKPLYWFFLALLLLGVVGAGAVAIILLLQGRPSDMNPPVRTMVLEGEHTVQAVLMLLNLIVIGFLGLVAAATMRSGASIGVMRLTVLVALVTGLLVAAYIFSETLEDVLGTALVDGRLASCALIMLLLLTLIGQSDRQEIEVPGSLVLQRLIYVNAVIFGAAIMLLIWFDSDAIKWGPASLEALIFVWGALTIAGFGIAPMRLAARRRVAAAKESIPARIALLLTCPRCSFTQALTTGLVHCAKCRGALVIEVEEPRCACGYLLYRLQGETCPECGRAIEPQRWWMASQGQRDNGERNG